MRILAIADRPPRTSVVDLVRNNNVDIIVTLGDLDSFALQELELITDIPKIGIYGNHCSGSYFEPLGIENMHLKTKEFGGLVWGGFEGCVRYKDSRAFMFTQEESQELLKSFSRVDIMLTHCPPFGINDDQTEIAHTGFIGLREYVLEKQPQYLFHGHTYPENPEQVQQLGETQIIYVYQDKIITI